MTTLFFDRFGLNADRTVRVVLTSLTLALLAGCAEVPFIPAPLHLPKKVSGYVSQELGDKELDNKESGRFRDTPKPPPAKAIKETAPPVATNTENEMADITLAFDQVPLPTFIQAVYANILKRNVNLDPKVTERQDLVTLRSGQQQTPSQIATATALLLKSYGIAVVDLGGLVRVIPDGGNVGYLPEIRRGRALPDTPMPMRPIFHHIELKAVRQSDISAWLRQILGAKINLQEDPSRNALLLSGPPGELQAALELIDVLDQPLMSGRESRRIEPIYWSADEIMKRVGDLLRTEGYKVGMGPSDSAPAPITFVPLGAAVNAFVVFASTKEILDHISEWIKDLDKPTKGVGRKFTSYQAQFMDAKKLAATLNSVMGGGAPTPEGKPNNTAPVIASGTMGKVVVDTNSNTLIIQGSGEDYGQILSLLQTLDRPQKAALIEVTVAEVSLNDNSQLGIEWLLTQAKIGGASVSTGTLGGLGIGNAGFNYGRLNSAGDLKIAINALASSNRATILSSPRVLARNGEMASIQVGQEVPIITSQQTGVVTGGTSGVLQSVQYRSTGVILNVSPVIHSGDRIDLDISQEVSAAQITTTGVSTSPTFGTRKISTRLSMRDGATVLLGGLISNNSSSGNAGVPLLKDVPVLGNLFRTQSDKSDRTELIILITPYIVTNDEEAEEVTAAFRKRLGPWAQKVAPPEITSQSGLQSGAGDATKLEGTAVNETELKEQMQ